MYIIAFFSMIIDHLYVFFPDTVYLKIIGRLAFPIFAYGIAEGCKKTRNIYKYALRLFITAVISQVPYFLYFDLIQVNVCFTLLMGGLVVFVLNLPINKFVKVLIALYFLITAQIFFFEFGAYGILLIMIFYFCENNKKQILFLMLILSLVFGYFYDFYTQIFAVFALPIIFYMPSSRKIKNNKSLMLFKYSIYPLHLFIFYLIKITAETF